MFKATCTFYLGQHYSLNEKNQDKEIQRTESWPAGRHVHTPKHLAIFKSNEVVNMSRLHRPSCDCFFPSVHPRHRTSATSRVGAFSGGSWGLGALGPAILWGPLQGCDPTFTSWGLGSCKPLAGSGAEPRRQSILATIY